MAVVFPNATFPTGAVPAAGTYILSLPDGLVSAVIPNMAQLTSALTYVSGGTTINAFLQTTFDDGLTWADVVNIQHLLANDRKSGASRVFYTAGGAVVLGDGVVGASAVNEGTLGRKWRVKLTVVGAYVGTLRIDVDFQYHHN